ncbi:MAG TPA: bifunctional phosphoribosylaminoimidazolecarboxamide formyltransferase/IMP cyclohydrolase [Tissierellaceae bacterium]
MKRALISVYDKSGIVDFAKKLENLGWEIISTGGTKNLLNDEGIKAIDIKEVTNFPEILDGRVKTLNPLIHGGILYKRDNKEHIDTIKKHDIGSIDMIVNNLYPFEETINKENVTDEEIIENIDIGGPSMIRAAAKNYKDVVVVIDPSDYNNILKELEENKDVSIETKRYLAGKVFNYTSYYDSLIAEYFNNINSVEFPEYLTLGYKKKDELRYGENSHQKAAFYINHKDTLGTMANIKQLHGKELSFNNINDSNGAISIIKEFEEPAVVAIKHSNPCGVGLGEDLYTAYMKAYECDKESIFGGIVALNRQVDEKVAKKMSEIFLEVIIAPGFSQEAIEILTKKKNVRLIEIKDLLKNDYTEKNTKKVLGGLLVQDRDDVLFLDEVECVTDRKPTEEEYKDLYFAWKVSKYINSNGVIIAKDEKTVGIGLGEVNRYWAVEKAIQRGKEEVKGSVLASDGFFPFKDSMIEMGQAGITAVIQPGGSIRDEEVIEEANRRGIAMLFTKTRHFKH